MILNLYMLTVAFALLITTINTFCVSRTQEELEDTMTKTEELANQNEGNRQFLEWAINHPDTFTLLVCICPIINVIVTVVSCKTLIKKLKS